MNSPGAIFHPKSEPALNGKGEFIHLLYRSLSRSENTTLLAGFGQLVGSDLDSPSFPIFRIPPALARTPVHDHGLTFLQAAHDFR